MSMAANRLFIESLRDKFSNIMTAATMEQALDIATCVLSEYEIEHVAIDNFDNDTILNAFLDAKRVEGKSDKTLKRYCYILKRAIKAMGVSSYNVSAYHIRKYFSDEKQRGVSESTIKGLYEILHSYFGWLHRDGLIRTDPMCNIGVPKVPKKVMEVYSDIDLEKLKHGCTSDRDKALVYLLKSSGCRVSEIVNLNREDIDFNNREFIVCGKGDKQRTAYMDMVTATILKHYLTSRTDDNPALFIGRRNERLQAGGIRCMLNVLGKKVGVEHVHPHKFRRTEATELSKRGMPVEQIQKLLGHEKIDTTMQYVVTDQDTVKNSYRKFA